jgi:glutathione peroxidase
MHTLYDFQAETIQGQTIPLSQFKDKVILIVNTASACGFTAQYAELESIYQQYQSQGLVILGFPCNQFGQQDPKPNNEIAEFCTKKFHISFPLFAKVEVNGEHAHPLFKWLTSTAKGILGSEKIKWNFTKFLINRQGQVIERFAPMTAPNKLIPNLEAELAKPH